MEARSGSSGDPISRRWTCDRRPHLSRPASPTGEVAGAVNDEVVLSKLVDRDHPILKDHWEVQDRVVLDAVTYAELARSGQVARDGKIGASLWNKQVLNTADHRGPIVPAQHIEDQGASDGVVSAGWLLSPIVGIEALPAEVVGIEPKAAAVVENPSPSQAGSDQNLGRLARRTPFGGVPRERLSRSIRAMGH